MSVAILAVRDGETDAAEPRERGTATPRANAVAPLTEALAYELLGRHARRAGGLRAHRCARVSTRTGDQAAVTHRAVTYVSEAFATVSALRRPDVPLAPALALGQTLASASASAIRVFVVLHVTSHVTSFSRFPPWPSVLLVDVQRLQPRAACIRRSSVSGIEDTRVDRWSMSVPAVRTQPRRSSSIPRRRAPACLACRRPR